MSYPTIFHLCESITFINFKKKSAFLQGGNINQQPTFRRSFRFLASPPQKLVVKIQEINFRTKHLLFRCSVNFLLLV